MTAQIDPVCGMTVDTDHAAGTSTFGGRTFWFCSTACKRKFDEAPARYATAQSDREPSLERHEPRYTKVAGIPVPKFGATGSGGAEYERGPETHGEDETQKRER